MYIDLTTVQIYRFYTYRMYCVYRIMLYFQKPSMNTIPDNWLEVSAKVTSTVHIISESPSVCKRVNGSESIAENIGISTLIHIFGFTPEILFYLVVKLLQLLIYCKNLRFENSKFFLLDK